MASSELTLKVGRLLAVAAWVDGEIHDEEFHYIKSKLQNLPGMSGADWVTLNGILESPSTEEEREQLIAETLAAVKSDADKRFVLEMLRGLVEADGVVTDAESDLLNEITTLLEAKSTGFFRHVSTLLTSLRLRAAGAETK